VNPLEPVAEAIGKGERLRPWPHERHVAPQDVPQLRQFIQLGYDEYPADSCQAAVALDGQWTPAIVAINPELSEFVHPERPTVLPKAKLGEQDGASSLDRYCKRYDQRNGR
jgi:hypothetical protein